MKKENTFLSITPYKQIKIH